MKVMLTTDYYPPHFGGGAEATLPVVVRALAERGHEVRVMTLNTDGAPDLEHRDGAVVHRASTIAVDRYVGLQLSVSPAMPRFVRRIIRAFKPDIIWAHNHFFTTSAAAHWGARGQGIPIMTDLSLADVNYLPTMRRAAALSWEKTVSRWMLRNSVVITGVSQACIDHGADLLGKKKVRGLVVPNGVATGRFFPNDSPIDPPVIGFVGRLIQNKGPQRLLEAAPEVLQRHPDARFVFVGDGGMRHQLEERASALGIARSIDFKGLVPHDEIPDLLRSLSVVVRPSDTEGLPVIALEAMASGLPLVATDVGGTREVLRHGKTGLLLRPDPRPEEVAGALNTLLGDPALMQAMRAEARRASEELDWDRCVGLREQVLMEYARRN